jgi:hypothetical protein
MNEMVNKCYSCDFHRQDCTFTLSRPGTADSQPKKRKLEDLVPEGVDTTKRYDDASCFLPRGESYPMPISDVTSSYAYACSENNTNLSCFLLLAGNNSNTHNQLLLPCRPFPKQMSLAHQ